MLWGQAMSISEDLERLARLRDSGDLTATEYRQAKKELLGMPTRKKTLSDAPRQSTPSAQSPEVSGSWFNGYGDNRGLVLLSTVVAGLAAWVADFGVKWAVALITWWLVYIALIIYLLPVNIARSRGHPNEAAISVLTFFGAWTGILWIAALVWAVSEPEPR